MSVVIGVAIDESGSMLDIYRDVIAGFDQAMSDLRDQDEDHYVIVGTFSNGDSYSYSSNNLRVRQSAPIDQIESLNYAPNGKTPLRDGVGLMIENVAAAQRTNPGYGALVVVLTDGKENNSQQYSWLTVKDAVKSREAEGWKFVYVGIGQTQAYAELTAEKLGMSAGSAMTVARAATRAAFEVVSKTQVT